MGPYHDVAPSLSRPTAPMFARFDGVVEEDIDSVSSGWREPVFRSYAAKVFVYFLNVIPGIEQDE